MTNIQAIKPIYSQTSTGSIDYQYYDQRARSIRSESAWKLLKSFFTDKKTSPIEESEESRVVADMVEYNPTKASNKDSISFKQAA